MYDIAIRIDKIIYRDSWRVVLLYFISFIAFAQLRSTTFAHRNGRISKLLLLLLIIGTHTQKRTRASQRARSKIDARVCIVCVCVGVLSSSSARECKDEC